MSTHRSPTIKDIAKKLGISHPAVSVVLTGKKQSSVRVSAETRERIKQAAREMGYSPSMVARSLRSGSSGMIGVIHNQTQDPIATRRLFAVLDAIYEVGMRPYLVTITPRFQDTLKDVAHVMLDARVDAVAFIMPTGALEADVFQRLNAAAVPIVIMSGSRFRGGHYYVDDRSAAYRMVFQHLLERGACDVALIMASTTLRAPFTGKWLRDSIEHYGNAADWPKTCSDEPLVSADLKIGTKRVRIRRCGLSPAVIDAGILQFPDIAPFYVDGYLSMGRIHQDGPLPDAVMCQVDASAMGAMRYCGEHNIKVPGELMLAGFGNEMAATGGLVPLTTVEHPVEELCQRAIQDLLRRRKTTAPAAKRGSLTMLPGTLIVRRSTQIY